jgi:hypothetical protein
LMDVGVWGCGCGCVCVGGGGGRRQVSMQGPSGDWRAGLAGQGSGRWGNGAGKKLPRSHPGSPCACTCRSPNPPRSAARSTPPQPTHLVHVAILAPQRRVELVVRVGKGVAQGQGVGAQRARQATLGLAQHASLAACSQRGRGGGGRASRGSAHAFACHRRRSSSKGQPGTPTLAAPRAPPH